MAKATETETKTIGDIQAQIKKEYGDILFPADNLTEMEGRIIPTTLGLDIVLSGGIPEGTIVNIAAPPKNGKTSLYLHIIANAQRLYKKKCYYVDVEGRLRTDLLKCIDGLVWTEEQEKATGIPRLQIIRSTEGNFLTAEKYLNIIEKIFSTEKGVIVALDSLAALCPEALHSVGIGDAKQMTGVQRLLYDFMRKISQLLPTMQSNLLSITHMQANPTAYGGPKAFGGNAIEYFSSIRLMAYSSPEVPKDTSPKIGRDMAIKCTASALGPPSGETTIHIRYGRGVDRYEDIVAVAEELGIGITKAGAWYELEIEGQENVKVQGKAGLVDYFREHPDIALAFETKIRKIALPARSNNNENLNTSTKGKPRNKKDL